MPVDTLHVLTSASGRGHLELARRALEGGAKLIQLREKNLPTFELLALARSMRELTDDFDATLIINDRVDIAIASRADGVHLGQDDLPLLQVRALMPDAIVGVSCSTLDEAREAERDGANYIGFGHMYPTGSKEKSTPPRTLEELHTIAQALTIPVVAIGGITTARVPELLRAGARGIAVIGALAHAEDPLFVTQAFLNSFSTFEKRANGVPSEYTREPEFTGDEFGRYSRQLMLPEIGFDGQQKLRRARVCIVGAGGLGSPAALYLAAAGIGTIGIVDFDTVDLSNLHRQLLYSTEDIGRPKVEAAADRLRAINPNVAVIPHHTKLDEDNARVILSGYDIVIDGSDSFATRYIINDTALALGIPIVFGAIDRFTGHLSVFGLPGGPCYRCLFPEPPDPSDAPSCSEIGVLGVLPGIIGMLQATEAIKLIAGIGEPLKGRLLMYDAMRMRFQEITIERDRRCPVLR